MHYLDQAPNGLLNQASTGMCIPNDDTDNCSHVGESARTREITARLLG